MSLAGGSEPQWSSESGKLFSRNSDQLMVVTVTAEPELPATRPEPLFDARYMPNPRGEPNYDVTPDGQRFLMIRREDPCATQAYVVLNWFEELQRLVPTDR